MSEEMKALRKQLLRDSRSGYDVLEEAQLRQMEDYCADYKAFLGNKTERLSARAAIAAAEAHGFVEYRRGMALEAGDKVYTCNRGKGLMLAVMGRESMAEGVQIAAARGVRVLTSEELALKDVSLTYVSRLMSREYTRAPLFRKVLQSICWQVSSGEQVIVVGAVQPDGTVKGGTGWGAEFAKICNKPLLVFDQPRNAWLDWQKDKWVQVENPTIGFAHFAATGTRFLEDNGRVAIQNLFARSFTR